jgi:predicted ATPase
MKNTIVVNLYGGPGAGKTTVSADLFARLKKSYVSSELVREYVKDWVWEGRSINPFDQVYILAKQSRKEQILYGKVDVVITDSPIWLVPMYEQLYGSKPHICQQIVDKFAKEAEAKGVTYLHVLVVREHAYDTEGRYQTEVEAKKLDQLMREYMDLNFGTGYIEIGSSRAVDTVMHMLAEQVGKNIGRLE